MTIRLALGDRRGEGWLAEKMVRTHRALGNHAEAAQVMRLAENIAQEVGDTALRDALLSVHIHTPIHS